LALGLSSRYAIAQVVCPPYGHPGFETWFDSYVTANGIRAIVPSDALLLAIRASYGKYRALLPYSPREDVAYLGQSKFEVFRTLSVGAGSVAEHLPPSLLLDLDSPGPPTAALTSLGSPLFLKMDAIHSRRNGPGRVIRMESGEAASAEIERASRDYTRALAQGFVTGRGVGTFILRWDGKILARFQHRRIHEVPHTGGVSSLRESFFNEEILRDAETKLEHLDWQGVAMCEYRLDERTGRFSFIELNGRFWGSLHLALHAGVDFPTVLLDSFHGFPVQHPPRYRSGVRCRNTVPGEVQYVWSCLSDNALGWRQRIWPVVEFGLLGLNPWIREDVFFPGDRRVGWLWLRRQLPLLGGALVRRCTKYFGAALPALWRDRILTARRGLKLGFYRGCRAAGLFALARWITAKKLRILCYHGVAIGDEHEYAADLFMRVETLRARLRALVQLGYPVLPLDDALMRLRDQTLPPNATVITFDDGFYGNYLHGKALRREFALPMTLYVTTYYVVKQTPIFRHVVKYLIWQGRGQDLDLRGLPGALADCVHLDGGPAAQRVQWSLIEHGEAHLSEDQRVGLCRELARRLGNSYDDIAQRRGLSLLSPAEIAELAELGMDIQLHTHRHHLPLDPEETRREVEDNRAVLEPLVGHACNHLCYPSGVFDPEHWPALERIGVKSATTCEPGLNDSRTPALALRRFLDSETLHPVEFEAELAGFAQLMRDLRGCLMRRLTPAGARNPAAYGR
jgi:peptidoglycan/xylan/chitin deacetylase (PgdA/CDA1 family)